MKLTLSHEGFEVTATVSGDWKPGLGKDQTFPGGSPTMEATFAQAQLDEMEMWIKSEKILQKMIAVLSRAREGVQMSISIDGLDWTDKERFAESFDGWGKE